MGLCGAPTTMYTILTEDVTLEIYQRALERLSPDLHIFVKQNKSIRGEVWVTSERGLGIQYEFAFKGSPQRKHIAHTRTAGDVPGAAWLQQLISRFVKYYYCDIDHPLTFSVYCTDSCRLQLQATVSSEWAALAFLNTLARLRPPDTNPRLRVCGGNL